MFEFKLFFWGHSKVYDFKGMVINVLCVCHIEVSRSDPTGKAELRDKPFINTRDVCILTSILNPVVLCMYVPDLWKNLV